MRISIAAVIRSRVIHAIAERRTPYPECGVAPFSEILGLLKDFVGARPDDRKRAQSHSPDSDMESDTIQGQLLMLDDQHKVAIHSRDGELWVAEFRGDHAELIPGANWFRLPGICHMSFSLRRALRFAVPLSNEMMAEIEKLHQRRLEPVPWCRSFRISAAAIANYPASVIFAHLLQRGRLIRDRLVASRKPTDRIA